MLGIDMNILIFIALATVAVGGVAYAFLYERINNERATERRVNTIQREVVIDANSKVKRGNPKGDEAQQRRKKVESSIKNMDKKAANRDQYMKKPPLHIQLAQAGLTVTVQKFYINSVICGTILTVLSIFVGLDILFSPLVWLIGTFGVPRWWVSRKKKKRIASFLNEFPNSLDIIVRAVKSGLPLNDGIRLIATEAPEPVRAEFKRIVDGQSIGKSTPQACMEMQESMPCSEAAFFGIVIQIQSQAGGNLSEALGNLSKVLRDRKKMKAKVQALSMEAKASGYIIAALPFIVATLVYLASPAYIIPLFTDPTGHIVLACSAVWMSIGVLVMKQMINFDF